ncbi:MAG: F-type H+-transporting ATPase subunit b [Nocardioidaceae bacterium]|nr:F-type H+-transporting ATPase subunit b [Nocardioidaceae bacterium]
MTQVIAPVPLASNFLVPNGTFFVELIAFGIIVFVLARYVIPPVNRAMTKRQEAIRTEFAELEEARDSARRTEEEYKSQLADARHEAAKIREEAREQGASIIAEMRQQAQEESSRILEHGKAQIEAERRQAIATLRSEVGALATGLAERIVGESLQDDARATRVVDRFLADLETVQQAEAHVSQDGTGR